MLEACQITTSAAGISTTTASFSGVDDKLTLTSCCGRVDVLSHESAGHVRVSFRDAFDDNVILILAKLNTTLNYDTHTGVVFSITVF